MDARGEYCAMKGSGAFAKLSALEDADWGLQVLL
jgi:hypothetical protein